MKKISLLHQKLLIFLFLTVTSFYTFTTNFAMTAEQKAQYQAELAKSGQAFDAQKTAMEQKFEEQRKAQADPDAFKKQLDEREAKIKAALQEKKTAEQSLQTTQKELADARAAAEAERKKMQEELAATKKAAEEAQADRVQLQKDLAEVTQKLQKSEEFQKKTPEEKAKEVALELAKKQLQERVDGKKIQEALERLGAWKDLADDVKKQVQAAKKDDKDKDKVLGVEQKTAVGGGIGVAALGGLGGLGFGLQDFFKPQGYTASGTAGAESGQTGTAGGAAGVGQMVIAGLVIDLSKLSMPSLKPLLPDLNKMMYASTPVTNLTDLLLKVITVSMVIKTQDSFNLTYAAMKDAKAEFNTDGTVEQINAKILQDCKDLKRFVTNLLDLIGETKRKGITLDGLKKIIHGVINQLKDNYTTLFTIDVVAQFTTLQQKVSKADLHDFMKKVNKTVQGALDAVTEDIDKAIKKRMMAGTTSKSVSEEMPSISEKTSTGTIGTSTARVQSDEPEVLP